LRAGEVESYLADFRAPDAHLVLAALAGHSRALATLDARLRGVAPQALSGIRLDRIGLDELLQIVREKLLVAESGSPKLATYSARGPLDGWLRVTIARTALSILRVKDPEAARSDDAEAIVSRAAEDDPSLEALRRRCAPALKRAIEETLGELPPEERTLLRLHFVDGLTIDDLAVVYQVHRATTARRLAKVRAAIFDAARARAMRELGIGVTEFESLMGAMLSRIDLTLRRYLGENEAPGSGPS
jgi:RNA polymerase sigma-70 factor, ECF subfamily